MARIHLPLLNHLHHDFFHQPTLGVPKLPQIVHRIETFKPPFDGEVHVYDDSIDITSHTPAHFCAFVYSWSPLATDFFTYFSLQFPFIQIVQFQGVFRDLVIRITVGPPHSEFPVIRNATTDV